MTVVFLPRAQCRVGDCSRRKWWRGGRRNGGQTYRWRMRCCWAQAWGCSSQSHRNTAFPLGCTCIHTYDNNLRLSINNITLCVWFYICISKCAASKDRSLGCISAHMISMVLKPDKHILDTETCSSIPGPSQKRGSSTRQGHDPCECHPSDGMFLPKAEVGHWLTDHNVALNSQDHQGPESNLSWDIKPGVNWNIELLLDI